MRRLLKHVFIFSVLCCLLSGAYRVIAYGQIGDLGLFGGISEGRRLPRTTEQLLVQTGRNTSRNNKTTLRYAEMVFLDGNPVRFDGLIDITVNGTVATDVKAGSFTVNYKVYPSPAQESEVVINRTANFRVNYRVEDSQIIYDYDIIETSWRETITTPNGTYTLDYRRSRYSASVIEDRTPGVNYYRGDISGELVYSSDVETTVDLNGSFYGYDCAWSSTETHRMDVTLMTDEWALQYQIRPSVSVNKVLQYSQNEPTAISFEGNYREVLQNSAGLRYDLFVKPSFMWDVSDSGTESLRIANTFEQLIAPDLTFLKGNAAEDDIAKLFAMQVLTGSTKDYQPSQAITRGQFMTMLAKAVKLPIAEPASTTRNSRTAQAVSYLYSDVDSTRPEYPYIMAISNTGIAYGRDNGKFYFDYPIERQEAFVAMIRALGLSQLGLDPTPATLFTDDDQIQTWAKRDISVAQMIGLIAPDESGKIYPTRNMSKGEAAGLINSLIEYMRTGLASDYAEQIVNFTR